MTDFDKAWREFVDALAEALKIPRILDWLAVRLERWTK